MKLLITGDLVINQAYDPLSIDGELIDLFMQSDFNIANLEAPVTDTKDKIIKTGPHLKADKESIKDIMHVLNIDLVTLANNHILDYGEEGLINTLSFCKMNSIATIGAGKTLSEAKKVYRISILGYNLSILNFAENEWASAKADSAGANPLDIIDNVEQIQIEKEKSDKIIVIIHGGHEYYNLPSPRMVKQYRFYAECGADLIVGHHTHCIGGCEIYRGAPIYYGLGNFLFTKTSVYEGWYEGLVLEICIDDNGNFTTKTFPVLQEKKTYKLKLLGGSEKKAIDERIRAYNLIIGDDEELQKHWNNYIHERYPAYLYYWSPLSFIKNRYIKAILRRMRIGKINKNGAPLFLNLMRCESHSDLSKEILTKYLK